MTERMVLPFFRSRVVASWLLVRLRAIFFVTMRPRLLYMNLSLVYMGPGRVMRYAVHDFRRSTNRFLYHIIH